MLLFETDQALLNTAKNGNYLEIQPFCGQSDAGHFKTHVADHLFYGLIDALRPGRYAKKYHKKFFKELVYRNITMETNESHQSRILKRDVKNMHEAHGADDGALALIVVYDRQRLSFVGFPSTTSIHSDCYVNAVVFPISNKVSLHFERREYPDQTFANKVFISFTRDDRGGSGSTPSEDINAIYARLMQIAAEMASAGNRRSSLPNLIASRA